LKAFSSTKFLSPNECIAYLWKLEGKENFFLSQGEIYFNLLEKIEKISARFPDLREYLNGDEKKLIHLADLLSRLFNQYRFYGESFSDAHPWQIELMEEVFEGRGPSHLNESLDEAICLPTDRFEVHLFALSYLPKSLFEFFEKLSGKVPVRHYHHSPSEYFWTDLLTNRERAFFEKRFKGQRVSAVSLSKWKEFVGNNHPLLSNFGKLGREYLKILENYNFETDEFYEISKETSLLAQVQNTFLSEEPSRTIQSELDSSIKLVQAGASKFREIEIAKDFMTELLIEKPHLQPEDFLFLAPDISLYEPYIHTVFGEGNLTYKIEDLPLSQSFYIQGFLDLLNLKNSKWDVKELFVLFENPCFRKKHRLTLEDVEQMREWALKAKVRFGFDKNSIDEETLFNHPDSFYPHTWEKGMEKMLMGLSFVVDDETSFSDSYPFGVDGLDFTHASLINTFFFLLNSLKKDLDQLKAKESLTLTLWADQLQTLMESYFSPTDSEDFFKSIFLRSLDEMRKMTGLAEFNFTQVYCFLKKKLLQKRAQFQAEVLNGITFRSIKEGGITPSKVIYLLGMQDDAFPRKVENTSLNLMQNYHPSSLDQDRYLFLTALLSAKEAMIFSYLDLSSEDGKSIPYSLLIDELFGYIQKCCGIQDFVSLITKKFPSLSFDSLLFSGESDLKSYSLEMFMAAREHYEGDKENFDRFLFQSPVKPELFDADVPLSFLFKLVKDPLALYINRSLGIYLDEEADDLQEFSLDPLNRYLMVQEALQNSPSEALQAFEKKEELPLGVFSDLSHWEFENHMDSLYSALKEGGIRPDELSAFNLEEPIRVPVGDSIITLRGEIQNVSQKGLVSFSRYSFKEMVKLWPQILVYLLANGINEIEVSFVKDKFVKKSLIVEDPTSHLSKYLNYYFVAGKTLTPLMPDWAEGLIRQDYHRFKKDVEASFSSDLFKNRYFLWAFKGKKTFEVEEVYAKWSPFLSETFQGIIDYGF